MNVGKFILNLTLRNTLHQVRFVSCWSCGKNNDSLVANLFCFHCKTLQKPDSKENFFKLMGVKETYDLDENDLVNKYKNLQKHLHPDKYGNKPKEEQEVSEEYSSLVNEAYKTLLEPLAREVHSYQVILNLLCKKTAICSGTGMYRVAYFYKGIYMLKLRGKEIPENTEVDNKFLMTIMEKNEEVENAESEEEIMNLNKENKAVIKDLQKKLAVAFFDGDLKRVTKLLTRMKYYTSIDTQIQAAIRNKGIIR